MEKLDFSAKVRNLLFLIILYLSDRNPKLQRSVFFFFAAPPSLLYVAFCDEDDNHICTYERIKAGLTEYFRVYVAWAGIGPFSVQWQHNGSAFACLEPHCRVERRSTNEMVRFIVIIINRVWFNNIDSSY